MRYPVHYKEKAIELRKKGCSIKEVANKLKIAKSTSSLWLRGVELNEKAKTRLKKREIYGQYKTSLVWKRKRRAQRIKYDKMAQTTLSEITFDKNIYKLLCAILYWAEGGKFTDTNIQFTNSDPQLIRTYLRLLRNGFAIDEGKFRANIHLHEYHSEKRQKEFWSKISDIPLKQFNKSWIKPNTKKRIRKNYPGCVRICYYSADIARQIRAIYTNLLSFI